MQLDLDSKPVTYGLVYLHVLHKGVQLGSVLGVVGGTFFSLWKGGLSSLGVARLAPAAAKGALIGGVLTSGLYLTKLSGDDADVRMADRAYRLQHNNGQNIMCYTSLAASAAAIVLFRRTPVISAFCLGQAIGTVGFLAASVAKDSKNPVRAWDPK
eukprot:TRINITY_DN100_c0_g1_i1.p1 TRINITY_DN100_c0_g1~~TRINITY_DN100_c0_g1_i1.p1  ORF type:complete len:156 (+),score=26.40 TRINITY_DN100_c0_g1_i1:143-610(+)